MDFWEGFEKQAISRKTIARAIIKRYKEHGSPLQKAIVSIPGYTRLAESFLSKGKGKYFDYNRAMVQMVRSGVPKGKK